MKKLVTICAVLVLCLCVSQASMGEITIDVYASSAPNGASGSPGWVGYVPNALYALENGLSSYGDRSTDPAGYEQCGATIDAWEIAVTSFKSWRGDVNPTGAFANEYGNRVHFGLHILGNGTQFSISQLSFVMASDDVDDSLGWSYALGTYNYNTQWVGINYGTDGIKGTADDTRISSGANTQLIDELVSRGSGNAWWPGGDLTDRGISDPQGAMDDHYGWLAKAAPITFSGIYTLGSVTGSDSVVIVPEPATMALLALGGVFLRRRIG